MSAKAKTSEGIEPVHVSDTCWLYGEIDGLCVVSENRDASGELKQNIVTIPWDAISRARGRRPMKR